MKAVVYDKKASPDKLVIREIDKPKLNEDELLIKISAVGLNAADYRSMKMGIIPKRKIFGADVAGIVEMVGPKIIQFKPGEEVFGDLASYGFGGLAEYAVAPEKLLVKKPSGISFEEAAALPMASLTALQALRNKGAIEAGKKVLIVGSGGGVGTFAVQLAKYFGAGVSAVCSTKNVEQALSLGADQVIDYKKEDFMNGRNKYDLILAINGNYPLLAYKRILNKKGICVIVGGSLSQIFKTILFAWILSLGSKKLCILTAKPDQQDLEFIADLVAKGKIKPVIESIYPLEKTSEAMRYLAGGHTQGKLIIKVI